VDHQLATVPLLGEICSSLVERMAVSERYCRFFLNRRCALSLRYRRLRSDIQDIGFKVTHPPLTFMQDLYLSRAQV
jgi:hypothetical protein